MLRCRATFVEAGWAALISLFLALLALATVLPLLDAAWFTEDMLSQYVGSQTWSVVTAAQTTHYGFPLGADNNYFPTGDLFFFVTTRALGAITGSPFVGVNLMILLSFPMAAALGVVLMRLVRLQGLMAVAFAVVIAMLPFHWVRALLHVALSTTVSMLTGLILVLLIASGRLVPALADPSHRRRFEAYAAIAALCVVTAWSGVYYLTFTVILCVSAIVLRYIKGASWRQLGVSSLIVAALVILAVAIQVPALLARGAGAPIEATVDRLPSESVTYAGILLAALIPGPLTIIPGYRDWVADLVAPWRDTENAAASNFGTIVTTTALLVFLVTLMMRARRGRPVSPPDPSGITPGVIGWLLVTTVLFFIPWGLNYAFAAVITPQIRAWDRLLPVLLVLFLLGAASVIRDWEWLHRGRQRFWVAYAIIIVTAIDVVVPVAAAFRASVPEYTDRTARARAYAAAVNAAIPGDCGILQLPLTPFPEPGLPADGANGYDHFWQSLVNADKNWSYGAFKNTRNAAWQGAIVRIPTEQQAELLQRAGFCGIHVDTKAYSPVEANAITSALTQRYGAPVAAERTEGWLMWKLPHPAAVTSPDQWPADVRSFFSPQIS